ncbi:hypothetical protein D3C86_2156450 [compost metagenome]
MTASFAQILMETHPDVTLSLLDLKGLKLSIRDFEEAHSIFIFKPNKTNLDAIVSDHMVSKNIIGNAA